MTTNSCPHGIQVLLHCDFVTTSIKTRGLLPLSFHLSQPLQWITKSTGELVTIAVSAYMPMIRLGGWSMRFARREVTADWESLKMLLKKITCRKQIWQGWSYKERDTIKRRKGRKLCVWERSNQLDKASTSLQAMQLDMPHGCFWRTSWSTSWF